MKKLVILILIASSLGCNSQTAEKPGKEQDGKMLPVVESFFTSMKKGNPDIALSNLLSSNENIDLKDSATINLVEKFAQLNKVSGVYVGYRLLKKRSIEDDIMVYSYLAKYDKKFYRFLFMFYNNGKSTKIYKFLFDDNIDIELEESLKLYAN